MTLEFEYSSALTGAAFMLYEVKQVAQLVDQGLTEKEIRQKVLEENIFQYEKMSSIQRALPYIIKRVNLLDVELRKMLMEGSLETSKTINLYAIMKFDRLFFEFMQEVIYEKFQRNDYTLEKKDVNAFFTAKIEQSDIIASWSETTIGKLKQVFKKILLETGMLKNLRSGELNRIIIDDQVKSYLNQIGDAVYVKVMGE